MRAPAPDLLDRAVGVATRVIAGAYSGARISDSEANEKALRALGRCAPGFGRAERALALETALSLVRGAMRIFEAEKISQPPPQVTQDKMAERLRRDFPQFHAESHRQAVMWGIIWFCK